MMNRTAGSVLTLITLLFSVGGGAAQTYTQMQWGMNKGVTPYAFGANINGTWRDLGTISPAGVWALKSSIYATISGPPALADGAQITAQAGALTAEDMYAPITFGPNKYWDNYRSVLTIPAGTQNINTSAYDCYLRNNNPLTVLPGPITVGAGVCYFGFGIANVDNSTVWGQAMYLSDNSVNSPLTTSGRGVQGYEYDFGIYGNGTTVIGNTFLLGGGAQPASATAVQIGSDGTDHNTGLPIKWNESFVSRNGASSVAFIAGATATSGNNVASQPIQFAAFDGGGALYFYDMTMFNSTLYLKRSNYLNGVAITSTNGTSAPTISSYSQTNTNINLSVGAQGAGVVSVVSPMTVSGAATFNGGSVNIGSSGVAGALVMGNGTSGTLTLQPTTGALGTVTATLPANTGTIAELNYAQTWSSTQTFGAASLRVQGSSTGVTTLGTANAGATDYTATFPANTGTVAELNLAQTWSAVQSFNAPIILKAFTVASLPSPCTEGSMVYVIDATAPTYNGALTGGGTARVPAFCDGSSWTSH